MRLHPLLRALNEYPRFRELVQSLQNTGGTGPHVLSAITPARTFAVAALHAGLDRPMLLITGRPSEARQYANELRAWAPDPDSVLLFPETDALPYDRLPSDPDKLTERLTALERLAAIGAQKTPLVVSSVRAALELVLEPGDFRESHRVITHGQPLPPADLAAEWLRLGYEPSALVDAPGLFSRRGGIVDVFPPAGEPLRIEMWGDEVDTIRRFDPATQLSTEQLESAAIGPAHEVLPRPMGVALTVDSLRPQFVDTFARDLRLLREGGH